MRSRPQSLLHLQLGQEVLYLLLAAFGLLSLVLAFVLTTKIRDLDAANLEVLSLRERSTATDHLMDRLRQIEGIEATLRAELDKLKVENSRLKIENSRLEIEISRLQHELSSASEELARLAGQLNNKPPIIILKETEGFSFPVGEATLTNEFREKLTKEAVPAFLEAARQYNATVIEVVGHTDELPIAGTVSNLDLQLIPFLRGMSSAGGIPPSSLIAGDNAGLGMARAAAVARFLMDNSHLKTFHVLPMSGAQVINTDDTVSTGTGSREASQRRRIELRARRANY
jgi:flagellar motor protein MotB